MLAGKVALVTGASQGSGRGIALQLGQAGAVVYITGRTVESEGSATLGSLRAIADEVEARGGKCIPIQCDHSNDDDVVKVFDKIHEEQGRLDILVNNAYAGDDVIKENEGKKFWEQDVSVWDAINDVGLRGYYACAVLAARVMVPQGKGLIVNMSSIGAKKEVFTPAYGTGKSGVDRMVADCGKELRSRGVAYISLWPGSVKTEQPAANLLGKAESIEFAGKAIVHLAADRKVMSKTGKVFCTADLASDYGFKDIDGQVTASTANPSS